MTPPPRNPSPARRRGFTLVELLVVILIIAILIALLVPAIAAGVRAANNARVSAEINNLATALADFKSRYGEYPPSRIVLHNNGNYSPSDPTSLSTVDGDLSMGSLNSRTTSKIRKFFPRVNGVMFNTAGSNTANVFTWDTARTTTILEGHQCLVFFLGGMPGPVSTGGTIPVTGFAKDPTNPFQFQASNQNANRTPPIFEFAPGRLVSVAGSPYPSYIDPLNTGPKPVPYAYFSSYGNNGYDPNDNGSGEPDDSGGIVHRAFSVNFVVKPYTSPGTIAPVVASDPTYVRTAVSAAPNPYSIGDASIQNVTWANPQTFQIIAAGSDGLWGLGGPFDANASGGRLPVLSNEPAAYFTTLRQRERDNITNFAAGKLD